AILLAEGQKSAVTGYCPNHGIWPENFVIPAKAGIRTLEQQQYSKII
ncbi:prepilin-type cleavage/methylation domain-containing protein, partial [Neisseria gonorrhoeae]